jgi:hypothetical protein
MPVYLSDAWDRYLNPEREQPPQHSQPETKVAQVANVAPQKRKFRHQKSDRKAA